MSVDFSQLRMPNIGGALQAGYETGREQKRQMVQESALAAYAQNPDDPAVEGALFQANPALGFKVREARIERDTQAQQRQAIAALGTGQGGGQHPTYAGLVSAGVNPGVAKNITDEHVARIKQTADFLGEAGLDVQNTRDPAQAAAKWASYVAAAKAQGMEVPADMEAYSPANVSRVLASAGKVAEAIGLSRPSYIAAPLGSDLINTRDPAAVATYQAGGGSRPAIGAVVADPRIAGGPAPQAPGSFR